MIQFTEEDPLGRLHFPPLEYNPEMPQQHVYDNSFDEDADAYHSRKSTVYPRRYYALPVPLDLINHQIEYKKMRNKADKVGSKEEECLSSNMFGRTFESSPAGDTGLAYYEPMYDVHGVDDVSWQRSHQVQCLEFIKLYYHEREQFKQLFEIIPRTKYRIVRPCIPSLTSNMMDIDINHLWDGEHRIINKPFQRVVHNSPVTPKYIVDFVVPEVCELATIKLRFVEYPCPYWLAGRTATGAYVLFCNHPKAWGSCKLFFQRGIKCEYTESKSRSM